MEKTNSINPRPLTAWILAARPKTLTAAIAPVAISLFLAINRGFEPDIWIAFLAIMSSLAIQIATNLVNDAYDFFRGADTADRVGPARMTQKGVLSPNHVLLMAGFLFFLSICLAIPLVVKGGAIIGIVLLVSILCAFFYTGGPYPLAYHGLGEVFVILFFGVLSTPVFYYLQTLTFSPLSLLAGVQIGFLCAVIIAINNLRDIKGDQKVNKRTLAVKWGTKFSKVSILILLYSPFMFSFLWILSNNYYAAFLPWSTIFLANRIQGAILKSHETTDFSSCFVESALLHFLFSFILCLSLCL